MSELRYRLDSKRIVFAEFQALHARTAEEMQSNCNTSAQLNFYFEVEKQD